MKVQLRPPTLDDVSGLVEFFAAIHAAHGSGAAVEAEIRDWLTNPILDQEENFRIALEGRKIVGWVDLWDQNREHERLFLDVRSHPRDVALYRPLLDWGEARASAVADGRNALLRAGAVSDDNILADELRKRGYRIIRHFFTMEIDLVDEPPGPEWPPGISVRTFRKGDERAVYEADDEAFRDHWDYVPMPYEDWSKHMLESTQFDPDLWFLAEDGDELAGFALCLDERRPDTGHLGVLGVRAPWRRRGIARALLLHTFAEFRRRGRSKADLGVDSDNLTGAVRLYERAGMRVVRRFDSYEKGVPHG